MSTLRKLRRQNQRLGYYGPIALEPLENRVLLNADLAIPVDGFGVDAPGPFAWGDNLPVFADITNLGDVDAGGFDTKIFLSQDALIDGGDLELDSFSVPGLTVGTDSINDRSLDLPTDGTDGDYFLIMQVDGAGVVADDNPANNQQAMPIHIDAGGPPPGDPDLLVSNVSAPSNVLPGDTFDVFNEISNPTSNGSAAFDVSIVLSTDTNFDPSDIVLATRNVPGLAPNSFDGISTPVSIPDDGSVPPGTYHIGVIADSNNQVFEADENNNTAGFTIQVDSGDPPPPAGIDLVIDIDGFNIDAPGPFNWGDTLNVAADVKNIGDTVSGNFDVQFFLSTDAVPDGADTLIHTLPLNSLDGNANSINDVQITLPTEGTLPDGDYSLLMVIDPANAVTETDENNNFGMVPLHIGAGDPPPPTGDPDLVAEGPDLFAPTGFVWGQTYEAIADVFNQGSGDAGAFTITVAFSTDNAFDGGDTVLATIPVTGLTAGPNSESFNDIMVTLPVEGTFPDGQYYVLVMADSNLVVNETDENNNVSIQQIDISNNPTVIPGIDLGVVEFDLDFIDPGSPLEWGMTYSMVADAFNQGDTAAGAFDITVALSADTLFDGGDTILHTFNVASLASGAVSINDINVSFPAPGTLPDGTYNLIMAVDSANTVTEADEVNNTMFFPVEIGQGGDPPPVGGIDLVIDIDGFNVDAPGPFNWGDTLTVAADVKNIGDTVSGNFDVQFFLSSDAVPDGSDTLIHTLPLNSLDGNTNSINDVQITLPTEGTLPDGDYSLLMVIDPANAVTETDENNNFGMVPLHIGAGDPPPPTGDPDLVAEGPDLFAPTGFVWGQTYEAIADVFNQGSGDAGAFTITVAFSTDNAFDGGDTVLATIPVTGLTAGPNSESFNDIMVTLPTDGAFPDGQYYVFVVADSEFVVNETDENNNIVFQQIDIAGAPSLVPGIDLGAGEFDLDDEGPNGPLEWGMSYTMAADAFNQGDTDAGAFDITIALSSDITLDGSDTILHTFNVASLASGDISINDINITLPTAGTLPDGSYNLIMAIDSADAVTEADELNNTMFFPVEIGPDGPPPGGDPDLAIAFDGFVIDQPGPVLWGATVTVAADIENQGGGDAPAFNVNFYLSQDDIIDGSDTLIDTLSIPGLNAGITSTNDLQLTLPATGTDGEYRLLMEIDSDQAVNEVDENNNLGVFAFHIGEDDPPPVEGIDLIADPPIPNLPPDQPILWGQNFDVSATIKNIGTTDAVGPFDVKVILSTDATEDPGDTLLATFSVPSVVAGSAYTSDVNLTLPAEGTLPDGPYHIIMVVDSENIIAEVDENNNTWAEPIPIGDDGPPPPNDAVDLVIDPIGINLPPEPLAWGQTVDVTVDVRNLGTTDAGSFDVNVLLSTDDFADASDIVLTSFNVPNLFANDLISTPVSLTLPDPGQLPDGQYHLIIMADSQNSVNETDEFNNNYIAPIQIGEDTPPPVDLADLVADPMNIDMSGGPLTWSQTLTVPADISNFGLADAGPFNVGIFFSEDAQHDATDTMMANFSVPNLLAGSQSINDITITLPPDSGRPDGSYHVIMVVDTQNVVEETDEFNNSWATPIEIGQSGPEIMGVDLVADDEFVFPPIDLIWGESYELPIDGFNQGDAEAGPFTISVFLSQDAVIDPSDINLADVQVPFLAPFSDTINDVPVTLPLAGTLPDGTYHVIVFMDSAEVIEEVDEFNNIVIQPITILETPNLQAGVDLALIDFGVDDEEPLFNFGDGSEDFADTYAWGSELIAFADIINMGDTEAGPFTVSVTLSTDAIVDAGDILLGETQIPSLAPGALAVPDIPITLPQPGTLADNDYQLIITVDSTNAIEETDEFNNEGFETIFIGDEEVDLKVESAFLPPNLFWNGGFDLEAYISNFGTGAVNQPFNITVYLSADSVIDNTDFIVGQQTIQGMGPQASFPTMIPVGLPDQSQFATSDLFLGVMIDSFQTVTESNETNNIFSTPVFLNVPEAPTGVDLAIPYVNAPPSVSGGQNIDVNFGLDNFGDADATGPISVKFFLSLDPMIDIAPDGTVDPSEIFLGETSIASLSAHTFSEESINLTLPEDLPFGFYHLVGIVNLDQAVEEADTFNNIGIGFVEVFGSGSDLMLREMFMPFDATWGQSIRVDVDVENFGGSTVDNVEVAFYLSDDFTFDGGDTLLGSTVIDSVVGGSISFGGADITLPDGQGEQFINIIAVVDPANQIEETFEDNNTFARDLFIGTPELPNLLAWPVPMFGPGQDNVDWAQTLDVEGIINNFSNAFVNSFAVTYYLSADDQLDGGDIELHSETVDFMNPWENRIQNVTLTMPAANPDPAVLDWYILAKADANDEISEYDEFDNIGWSPIFIGSKPADLGGWLQTEIAPETSVVWGDAIALTGQIENFGGSDAGAFDVKYYLSDDPEIDGTDTLVATQSVASLAADSSTPVLNSITLPADPGNLGSGTVFLIAMIDADNTVAEVDDFNNIMGDWLTTDIAAAELVGFHVDGGFNAAWGQDITLNFGLGNFGTIDAANFDVSFYLANPGMPIEQAYLLGSTTIDNLGMDQEIFEQLTLTLPDSSQVDFVIPGQEDATYELYMKVDSGEVIDEIIEENNLFFMPLRMEMLRGMMEISDSSNIPHDRMIEMGTALLGQDPLVHTFTIANIGQGPLHVTEIFSDQPDFQVSGIEQIDTPIDPGVALTFEVSFTPTQQGFFSGNIQINTDDPMMPSEWINVWVDVASAPVDLAITSVNTDKDANWGDTLSLTVDIANLQSGTVDEAFLDIMLSDSPDNFANPPGMMFHLFNQPITDLIAGNSNISQTIEIQLPEFSPFGFGGQLYLQAMIHPTGSAFDENFDNNENSTPIEITSVAFGKPDLTFTSLFLPEQLTWGDSFDVFTGIRNVGQADAAGFNVAYYFSTDDMLDDQDLLLSESVIPGLSAQAEIFEDLMTTLPDSGPDGTNFIIVKIDAANAIAEDFEGNNLAVARFNVGTPSTLDLVAEAVTVPDEVNVGEEFSFSLDIGNAGDEAADNVRVEFFLSESAGPESLGIFIGSIDGNMPAGALLSFDLTGFVPNGFVQAGSDYYLKALVDADNRFMEVDEFNNMIVSSPITATAGNVDLTAQYIDAPTEATLGQNFSLSATVSNTGTLAAAPFYVDLYLSSDATKDASDFYLSSQVLFGLQPGDRQIDFEIFLPEYLPLGEGTYQLLLDVDGGQSVDETDELNNLIATTLVVSGTPDLQLWIDDLPFTTNFNQVIDIADTVENIGLSDATAFDISYYLSTDAIFDDADTLLSTRNVAGVGAGSELSNTTELTMPADGDEGQYFIIAVADPDDVIEETFEQFLPDGELQFNNIAAWPIELLEEGLADLKPTAVSTAESSDWGQTIVVQNTIKNIGVTDAEDVTVTFYLSDNQSITTRDVILGTRVIESIGSGLSNSQSTVITLPAENPFGQDGDFYIGVLADSAGVVNESNEENNIRISAATIEIGNVINVDLVAAFVDTPPDGQPGQTIDVYNEVYNSGSSAAAAFTVDFFLTDPLGLQTNVAIGSRAIAALAAGEFNSELTALTLPEDLADQIGQTWQVTMIVNADQDIEEKTFDNNTAVSLTSMTLEQLNLLDLQANSVDVDAEANWGDTVSVNYQLQSNEAIISPVNVALYLSQNGSINNAQLISEFPVELDGALDGSLNLILPPQSPFGRDGNFQLILVADSQNILEETDEANNTQATTINIGSGLADLVALDISAVPKIAAGASFEAFNSVANFGSVDAAAFDVFFYLTDSSTAVDTATDTLLGSRHITSLTADNFNWTMSTLTVPANVVDGDYYLAMLTDRFDDVEETSETNNTIFSQDPIKVRTLTINPDDNEPNNTTSNATAVTFDNEGQTDTISATLHTSADRDYYTFTTPSTASGFAKIKVVPDDTLNAAILIYNNSGVLIGGADSSPEFGEQEIFTTFSLAPARTYKVLVKPIGDSLGSYSLDMELGLGAAGDAYEANDTSDDAYYLGSANATLSNASIHVGSDIDYYRFAIPATSDGLMTIAVEPDPTLDAILQVFDESNQLVGSSDLGGAGSAESITLQGEVGDNFYARVSAWALSTGGYDFDLDFSQAQLPDSYEPNEDLAAAYSLTQNTLTDPTIHKNDNDVFSLTIPDGATSLEAKVFGSGDLDARVTLYDAAGNLIRSVDRAGENGNETLLADGFTAGDQVFLAISSVDDTTGPYSLQLEYSDDLTGDHAEPNQTRATAFALDLQTDRVNLTGLSIHDSADRDYYSFVAPANSNGAATIVVSPSSSSSLLNVSLRLLDADGEVVTSTDATGSGQSENLSILNTLVAGETYILDVNAWGTSGDYRLNVVTPLIPAEAQQAPGSTNAAAEIHPLAQASTAHLPSGSPAEIVVVEEIAGANDDDLSFGTTPSGTSLTFNIHLLNIGGSDLVISSVAISGADSSVFSTAWVDGLSGTVTIPAGQSEELAVTFAPTATQLYSDATLTINNNDTNEGAYALTLSGTGSVSSAKPDIDVRDLNSVALTTLTFDDTVVDDDSTKSFLIANTGTSSLRVSSAVISGADADSFELVFGNLANKTSDDYIIAADGQRAIQVRFQPIDAGAKTAVLTLTSNDPDETTVTINLTGSAGEPNLVVDLTPDNNTVANALNSTINFGQQVNDGADGQTGQFPIDIVNTGTSALTISSISFGQQDSPFSITGIATDGVTIQPGDSIAAVLLFDPTANGSFIDTLTVNSDDLDSSTMQFTLTGQAVEAFTQTITTSGSVTYTDADGDLIEVTLAKGGIATLTYAGGSSDGSDLDSISITDAGSGSLVITLLEATGDGKIDIDSIMVVGSGFGLIQIDGAVNTIDVDGAIKTVTLTGALSGLDADGAVGTLTTGGLSGSISAASFKTITSTGAVDNAQIATDPTGAIAAVNLTGNVNDSSITTASVKSLSITGAVDGLDLTTSGAKAQVGAVNITGNVAGLDIATGSIKSLNVTGDLLDSSLSVLTGKGAVGALNITGDAEIDITALGAIKGVTTGGNLAGDIAATGAKGSVKAVSVGGDLSADLAAVAGIKAVNAGGDITSANIDIQGAGKKSSLGAITSGGHLNVTNLNIEGAIKAVTVGSQDNTANLLGNLTAGTTIKTVNVFGDIDADITSGSKLGTVSATGSLQANASITSTAGDIDNILIGQNIYGNVTANNGLGRIKQIQKSQNTFIDPDTELGDLATDHISGDLAKTKWTLI